MPCRERRFRGGEGIRQGRRRNALLREWVAPLQEIQLKREVAGTSRIEGAEFTEVEFDGALQPDIPPEKLRTR